MGVGQSTKFLPGSAGITNVGTKGNGNQSNSKASKEMGKALEKLEREKRELQEDLKRLKSENEELSTQLKGLKSIKEARDKQAEIQKLLETNL